MKRKSNFTLPSKYILLTVTMICIAMITLTFTTNISIGPLKTISGYVFIPVQNGINQIGVFFSQRTGQFKTLKELQEENEKLQEQVDELTVENNTLQQDKYELDRLRELMELSEKYSDYNTVAARIIGKDPGNWFNTFVIDKGSDDGLAVDMNIMASGGLVGIIIDIGSDWATVRSIIDDSSNVSCMVLATSDRCIVSGDLQLMNDGVISFSKLSDTDNNVNAGSKIVTSNVSAKYLPGILVGYIKDIQTDSNNLTKSGTITPVVDFEHLQEVLVITDLK